MFFYSWRFSANGRRFQVKLKISMAEGRLRLYEDGALRGERVYPSSGLEGLSIQTLRGNGDLEPLEISIGYIGWWTVACQARWGGEEIFRSHKRDFAPPESLRKFLTDQSALPQEQRDAMQARAKARLPSIYVDVALGIGFFLIARAYDLQTAAVVGAIAAVVLLGVQRFVKVDLLGGFALFGVGMSLISAGLAVAFDSDLAVKLRGSVVGAIAASAFLADWAFGGRYLGARLAGYMESLLRLSPPRASLAMGCAGLCVIAIDTAVAFALPTDWWLIYNAFLDWAVAMPIVFTALYFARERTAAGAVGQSG